MSKEARTIRPFTEFGEIGALLHDAVVHFGDITCAPNSSVAFDADAHTFGLRSVKIEWASNERDFDDRKTRTLVSVEAIGLDSDGLSLLAIASSGYLKLADVVFEVPLSSIADLERVTSLTDPIRAPAFDASHHGFGVDVYVVLNSTVDPRPLRPWRKGTWLAHITFDVVTEAASTLFRITPMDAAKKEELGLGPKTLRYLDLDDHDPLESFQEQADEPIFYVDDQVLGQLNATARTPASKTMQLQLAMDFIDSILAAASRHPDLSGKSLDDVEGSLLARVIRAAAGPGSRQEDRAALFSLVADDPGRVAALAESTIDIQASILESLQGTDT